MFEILVKKLPRGRDLPLPAYMSPDAAGMDLYAANKEPLIILPAERVLVPTGLQIALPPGYEAQIRPRSGLAYNNGICVLNSPGTIDADYRGEIKVLLANLGEKPFVVSYGDRIAQLVPARVVKCKFSLVEELPETKRGEGGFGHTGR